MPGVGVVGSGPHWTCLCETKQAIKDHLQGQLVQNQGHAGGGHQPSLTGPHRTTLHSVTLNSSHRCSSTIQSLWSCKQVWKTERPQSTRLAGGCGRRCYRPHTRGSPVGHSLSGTAQSSGR
eukprot:179460-Chlamydomonas_euryale.AAC.4